MSKVHNKKPIFEYSKINEYIYIGTNLCCAEHFKKTLLNKGIKADISLEERRLDHPFGVDYYLWLPTKDQKAPDFNQLIIGAKFIRDLVKNKIKIYVHCEFGHGRSPTLVIAYLILEGKNLKEAVGFVSKKRPSIHLSNEQKKALEVFSKKIR